MKRVLIAAVVSLALSIGAWAGWNGSPESGGFAIYPPSGGATYTGPIDINGTAWALWSTRCGAKTYSGNILDIWDSATGSTTETVLGCDGAGNIVVKSGSALATTCASGCKVKTMYDQSGANKCTTACDMTQATNANRPTFNSSLLNSKSGLVFASGQCFTAPSPAAVQSQPFTVSAVYNDTTLSGAGDYLADTGGTIEASQLGGSGKASIYASGATDQEGTAADNATHAVQGLFNAASSALYIDGTNNSGNNIGTGTIGTALVIGSTANVTCSSGSHLYVGNLFEVGVWAADKSVNNATMNSNQHAYWGF